MGQKMSWIRLKTVKYPQCDLVCLSVRPKKMEDLTYEQIQRMLLYHMAFRSFKYFSNG
jgi:hypothetical protein